MELYACGFNAHNQLLRDPSSSSPPTDLLSFRHIASGSTISVLFAGWSSTVLSVDGVLHLRGAPGQGVLDWSSDDARPEIASCFGDHNGPRGAVTAEGLVFFFEKMDDARDAFSLRPLTADTAEAPRIAHVAVSGAGTVAVVLQTAPRGQALVSHICTFASIDAFEAWYSEPASPAHRPSAHHMLPAQTTQLCAGATFFLLTSAGDIWTWATDARYPHCLARPISATHPAEQPGRIDALLGIRIKKIAAGGWIGAVVAESNDLYIWGGRADSGGGEGEEGEGGGGRIEGLPAAGEDVGLVDLGDGFDVVDAGVGAAHVVALDGEGRVWAVGVGDNGQLATEEVVRWRREWALVEGLQGKRVVGVGAGERSSFALVEG